ncbi:MAG: hypothetical protein H0T89_28735 [Deltaproteobacteria bacterium]|nr:hypothetical protein [Deltaproteobacteria bacterium]MDQ3295854.1 hypothetical protein [Myxococcota bacterium]
MKWTRVLLVLALAGCVNRAKEALAPEPEGGGTLTCREIVETCDSACSDPLCLHRCSPQGIPEARAQHDALLSCGENHGCTDEECMRTNCPTELETCLGPDPQPSAPAE